MPTFAVLADPPAPGVVLADVADACSLAPGTAAELYEAMLADVCRAIEAGGGDLLINYREADAPGLDIDVEARLRESLSEALEDPEAARYEIQVGETFSGRVGNTVTHLLTEEDATSVVALRPTAALFARRYVGTMAMKLRSAEVVCCPSTEGGLAAAGFTEPIDFTGAYADPAVETLTDRALSADRSVDFMECVPTFDGPDALSSALPVLSAKHAAGRPVPERTARVVRQHGVSVST